MKCGPKPVVITYATSLGITKKQLYTLGGMEKVKAMSEETRAIFINMAKRSGETVETRKAAENG
jgi:hypothetical protein